MTQMPRSWERFVDFGRPHRPALALVTIVGMLGAIYGLSRQADQKVLSITREQPDFSQGRTLSSKHELYRRRERLVSGEVERLEKLVHNLNARLEELEVDQGEMAEAQEQLEKAARERPTARDVRLDPGLIGEVMRPPEYRGAAAAAAAPPPPPPPEVITFPVKVRKASARDVIQVPAGSYVKAKLLTGVEAPEGKALPVLLQADYAFVGPNRSRLDLSGCFLIAKSTGNLSIERVEMQARRLSCVSRQGRLFERALKGFVADAADSSFAVMGSVRSKQGRVAATSFLSSVVAGVSDAIAKAQTSVQDKDGEQTLQITGNQRRYLAASGASNAANSVAQWYLKHAERLLPTIAVGSGQDVWLVLQESVDLPKDYFEVQRTQTGGLSFLPRLNR